MEIYEENIEDLKILASNYFSSIQIKNDYTDAYVNRGVAKKATDNIDGACEDWNVAAKLGSEKAKLFILTMCNN